MEKCQVPQRCIFAGHFHQSSYCIVKTRLDVEYNIIEHKIEFMSINGSLNNTDCHIAIYSEHQENTITDVLLKCRPLWRFTSFVCMAVFPDEHPATLLYLSRMWWWHAEANATVPHHPILLLCDASLYKWTWDLVLDYCLEPSSIWCCCDTMPTILGFHQVHKGFISRQLWQVLNNFWWQ